LPGNASIDAALLAPTAPHPIDGRARACGIGVARHDASAP
jgi:hypothetical protein